MRDVKMKWRAMRGRSAWVGRDDENEAEDTRMDTNYPKRAVRVMISKDKKSVSLAR